jgi:hypothetical protein
MTGNTSTLAQRIIQAVMDHARVAYDDRKPRHADAFVGLDMPRAVASVARILQNSPVDVLKLCHEVNGLRNQVKELKAARILREAQMEHPAWLKDFRDWLIQEREAERRSAEGTQHEARALHVGRVSACTDVLEMLNSFLIEAGVAAPAEPQVLMCPRCGSRNIETTVERHTCLACGAFGWPSIGTFISAADEYWRREREAAGAETLAMPGGQSILVTSSVATPAEAMKSSVEPPWTQERMDAYSAIANMPMVCKSIDYGGRTLNECVEKAIDRAYQHGRQDEARRAAYATPPAAPAEAPPAQNEQAWADLAADGGLPESQMHKQDALQLLLPAEPDLAKLRAAFDALLIEEVRVFGGIPEHKGRCGREQMELREAIAEVLAASRRSRAPEPPTGE